LASRDILLSSSESLLLSVLSLLALLATSSLDLLGGSVLDESVLGLELLGQVKSVVDQSESDALSASELATESEGNDQIRSGLVQRSQLLLDLSLGDRGARRVDDLDDHLLSGEQAVGDDLSGTDRNDVTHDWLLLGRYLEKI
ncbi:hypothetical protein PFISCL1PPCAC_16570, partial [Pristionchus fissidentatus]